MKRGPAVHSSISALASFASALAAATLIAGCGGSDDPINPPANHAPVANAGVDRSVSAGDPVTLDGSGSSDLDADALTYSWTLTSRPTGSTAALSGATTVGPTFTADLVGSYEVQLVVNDGTVDSVADSVIVTAVAGNQWSPTSTTGAPSARYLHTAVWTG